MAFLGLFGGGKAKPTASAKQLTREASTEGGRAGRAYQQYQDQFSGGQDELEESIRSSVSAAMPEFRQGMQGVQESEIRRGVGVGGLGTSYEGDLESAFQRNIANAAGAQALNLYNTKLGTAAQMYESGENRYLGLLSGNRDYETALQNQNRKRKSGLMGGLGALAGGIIGGPFGAELGAGIGSGLGGL